MLESCSKWRGDMMGKGGDDGPRTVDCLRGRLLAERVASKAAKAEADLMAKRLGELERKLAVETKCRNRAEKRLKYALKKLESLKLLDFSSQLSLSESSVSSSSACFSGHSRSETQNPDSQAVGSRQCGAGEEVEGLLGLLGSEDLLGDYDLSISSTDSLHRLVTQEGSWSSVGTAQSHNKEESRCQETSKFVGGLGHHESTTDSVRGSSASDNKLDGAKHQSEHVDDRLALVPVSMWLEDSGVCRQEMSNNVQGVLLSLRNVKEQLQNSMGRRAAASSPKELYGL